MAQISVNFLKIKKLYKYSEMIVDLATEETGIIILQAIVSSAIRKNRNI